MGNPAGDAADHGHLLLVLQLFGQRSFPGNPVFDLGLGIAHAPAHIPNTPMNLSQLPRAGRRGRQKPTARRQFIHVLHQSIHVAPHSTVMPQNHHQDDGHREHRPDTHRPPAA